MWLQACSVRGWTMPTLSDVEAKAASLAASGFTQVDSPRPQPAQQPARTPLAKAGIPQVRPESLARSGASCSWRVSSPEESACVQLPDRLVLGWCAAPSAAAVG